MTEQAVDVLIVGAGPSRAVAAHTLASRGFSVLCLEQGDRVDSTTLPGNKPEFELLNRTTWSWDGNKRGRREDYPLNMDESDTPAMMFAAVGGSSVIYGAHWQRLLPSDFRVRSLDGVADDWPISYDDVEPFYRRVDEFIGVAGLGGDPAYPEQDFPRPPNPLGAAGLKMAEGMNKLGWHWWPGTHAIPGKASRTWASASGGEYASEGAPPARKRPSIRPTGRTPPPPAHNL